jgi:O6-methylguanine-DNA--protein-cysteine methyltransferase
MKKTLIAAMIFSLSVGAAADMSDYDLTDEEFCEVESEVAYEAMDTRQMGVPLHTALALSDNSQVKAIIHHAYEAQQFQSEYAKEVIKVEFGKLNYYKCLARMSGKL